MAAPSRSRAGRGSGRARARARRPRTLTVAVTGATGTVGQALLARLAGERSVGRIVVVGRRAPARPPGPELDFRRADVRDPDAVTHALRDADVVVHLAFALYGLRPGEEALFATNVEGTRNVARAAVAAGARRFVYTSSGAVYGFHAGAQGPLAEDAPLRASTRHFYSRHKAQAELLVAQETAGSAAGVYVFRPGAIAGPHAGGAAVARIPGWLRRSGGAVTAAGARAGLRPVLPAPPYPLQFVHEDDVAAALVRAVTGEGPPGPYNLAGGDALTGGEVLSLLGIRRLPLPRALTLGVVRTVAATPPLLPAVTWPELLSGPLILDTTRARKELGWRPRFSSAEALRETRRALGW